MSNDKSKGFPAALGGKVIDMMEGGTLPLVEAPEDLCEEGDYEDCPPTWEGIFPALVEASVRGTTSTARVAALGELTRAAKLADKYNQMSRDMVNWICKSRDYGREICKSQDVKWDKGPGEGPFSDVWRLAHQLLVEKIESVRLGKGSFQDHPHDEKRHF